MPSPSGQLQRLGRLAGRLGYIRWTAGIAWEAASGWLVGWLTLLLAQSLLPVAAVLLMRGLVNALAEAVRANFSSASLTAPLLYGGAIGTVLLLTDWTQAAMEWVRGALSEQVQERVTALIQQKAVEVDVAFFESPEYHDLSSRACSEAPSKTVATLESAGGMAQAALGLLGLGALLVGLAWWLPLVVAAGALPGLYVALVGSRRQHQWWESSTGTRRRTQYFHNLMTSDFSASEVRLFNLAGFLREQYWSLRRGLIDQRIALARRHFGERLLASALAIAVSGAVVIWTFGRTVAGVLSLGDAAMFYGAFSQGQGMMRALFASLNQFFSSTLVLDDARRFLELQPSIADPEVPIPTPAESGFGVSLKDASFRYPGSERPALEGFNLEIPAGKIVAVVGPNGAGKSTLARLVCRFFDPERGRIEFAGEDLRRFRLSDLRKLITVQFQFPVYYHATVNENIRVSDLSDEHTDQEIAEAARAAGATEVIAKLPHGYETVLGKWFLAGEDLSAGEWQRLALARAFLRRSPLMILDEPTSFMDSWSEADWFDRFRGLAAGRTALIITHRFSIAMRADLICVMERGQVIETGTHHELLARGGAYAQAWSSQVRQTRSEQPLDAHDGGVNTNGHRSSRIAAAA